LARRLGGGDPSDGRKKAEQETRDLVGQAHKPKEKPRLGEQQKKRVVEGRKGDIEGGKEGVRFMH